MSPGISRSRVFGTPTVNSYAPVEEKNDRQENTCPRNYVALCTSRFHGRSLQVGRRGTRAPATLLVASDRQTRPKTISAPPLQQEEETPSLGSRFRRRLEVGHSRAPTNNFRQTKKKGDQGLGRCPSTAAMVSKSRVRLEARGLCR